MSKDVPTNVVPLVSELNWASVTGQRLEELVWGLLDDMGGREMIWRAGSSTGVTAGDGGRDIEATMFEPGRAGEPMRQRWWVEAKGRASTVKKRHVMDAVLSAVAHSEVDVVVLASNSVFANSANDWVREWNRTHRRPIARLWDRENLAAMVRRAPQVAARVLPEALGTEDRLRLLIERFGDFGEIPSAEDLAYFWNHPEAIQEADSPVEAVALMLHADPSHNWRIRPWSRLLTRDENTALEVLAFCFHGLVWRALGKRIRSVPLDRTVEVAAHLLVSFIDVLDLAEAAAVAENPFRLLVGGEEFAQREDADHAWRDQVVLAVLRRAQLEMAAICGHDCARVTTEATPFEPAMDSRRYFERFDGSDDAQERWLTITTTRIPCVVGLTLSDSGECLVTRELDESYGPTPAFFGDLRKIVQFRRANQDSQFRRGLDAAELES